MAWTDDQLNAIRESYWKSRAAECPTCQRAAEVHDEARDGEMRRTVIASCPTCNECWQITPDSDPQAERFRPWSAEEKRELLTAYGKQILVCPVEGTMLDSTIEPIGGSPSIGARALVVRCCRCGQACSEPR